MIKELHAKLLNGETTSAKLTEEYFNNIEKKDKEINAYLTLTKDLAMKQAEAIDAKIKKGEKIDVLAGIPCAIKDNICVKDKRTTAGSKILDNYIAPYDATVVKKIKDSGAVILGKTNLDEFAMGSSTENSAYQPTKNPKNTGRVPGGSSGGSAAAVAGNLAPWALGSDTGGSIRQPAAFCGVVGLKPTYGRVSRSGLIAMASSLDQIGPFGKTVEDAAIVFSRIAGHDNLDATSAPGFDKNYEDYLTGEMGVMGERGLKGTGRGIKIGIPKEYLEGLDREIKKVFDAAVEKFKNLGAQIQEISLPHSQYALAVYYIIMTAEVSSNLARFDGVKYGMRIDDKHANFYANDRSELVSELYSNDNPNSLPRTLLETYLDTRRYGFGEEVKRRIMLGTYALSAGYYDAYYKKAQKVRTLIKKDFENVFNPPAGGVDLIFSPTAPEVAFKFGEKTDDPLKMYLSDIYTVTANLTGVPAISFPIGTVNVDKADKTEIADGKGESACRRMPVGGQLMGKWFDEENLLNAAYSYEVN